MVTLEKLIFLYLEQKNLSEYTPKQLVAEYFEAHDKAIAAWTAKRKDDKEKRRSEKKI